MIQERGWVRRLARCAALGAVLAGCVGDGPDPGDAAFGLAGPDRPLGWTLAPEWVAGGVDAPEWAAFGLIRGMAFDAVGNLYVLDGRGRRVTVVDSLGALVRTVGVQGEGPGELRFPSALAVHPDGTVTVYDPGQGALVVYGPDGSYLRNVPLDRDAVPAPEGPLLVTADGALVSPTLLPVAGDTRLVVRYSDQPAGAHTTLYEGWAPPLPEVREPDAEATGGLRIRLPPVIAFHPGLLVAPRADGSVALVDSTTWRVTLLNAQGSVTSRLERPIAPLPVTEDIRAAERARRLALAEGDLPRLVVSRPDGGTAAVPPDAVRRLEEARIEGMGFHPVIPVVEELLTDPDGGLWVRRTGDVPGEAGPVDVLGPGLGYLGTLAPGVLPAGAVPGPGGRLAVAGVDSLGAPLVTLYRLVRSD